jgi:hypothetical protein
MARLASDVKLYAKQMNASTVAIIKCLSHTACQTLAHEEVGFEELQLNALAEIDKLVDALMQMRREVCLFHYLSLSVSEAAVYRMQVLSASLRSGCQQQLTMCSLHRSKPWMWTVR